MCFLLHFQQARAVSLIIRDSVNFQGMWLFTIFFLYQSIVEWQCCISFRCTAKWFNYTCTYIYFFQVIFPFRLLTNIEQNLLYYTISSCWLFILNIAVCTYIWYFWYLLLLLSRFSRARLCATPRTAAHQAPLSLGFFRQDHWSRLPFPSPMHESKKWKWSHSVVSNCLRHHGLQPTRLLGPWDFPGKSTGVGCHCLANI